MKYSNTDFTHVEVFVGTALNVNARGTVTIPRKLRDILGVRRGGLVSAEISDGKVVLEPAMLTPYRIYSEEEIARLRSEDTMSPAEAARLKATVRIAKAKTVSRG